MRIFRGLLFLGSGEFSLRGVEALHHRLNDALSHSGGLQQSRSGEGDLDAQERVEIEEAVRDIASALLGREIIITDEQPYPSNDDEGIVVYLRAKAARGRKVQ